MPAFRVIPIILYNGEQAVKTVQFSNPRNIGSVVNLARLYEMRGVDEIVFLDIFASKEKREPNFKIIKEFAKNLSIPFVVGGGIKSVNQADEILSLGADRLIVGNGSGNDGQIEICHELSEAFGKQAVIGAIDYHRYEDLFNRIFDIECGEYILTCIDLEGTMKGSDGNLHERICGLNGVSIIVNGGIGTPEDVLSVANFSGVGIGSMFQFTQYTPKDVKRILKSKGIEVRE